MTLADLIASLPHKTPAQRRVMRENAQRILTIGPAARLADARALIEAIDAQDEAERTSLARHV